MPALALHRCSPRHGIRRLPLSEDGQSPPKKKVKPYPLGYLPVDLAEVHPEEGRGYLCVAMSPAASRVAFAELPPRATKMRAAAFLRRAVKFSFPFK